jgi:hypothetical protein
MRQLREQYLIISPATFHYLKFILEAYDNLAILSSYDSDRGVVVIRYPEELASEVFQLLGSIAPQLNGSCQQSSDIERP